MSTIKYIALDNLLPRLPLMATAFWWMFLDYVQAPEWTWGIVGVILLITWANFLHAIFTKDRIDIFESTKHYEYKD